VKNKILPILIAVATILVIANLVALDVGWLRQQKSESLVKTEVSSKLTPTPASPVSTPSATSDSCGTICQQTINERVSQAVATLSGKETKIMEKTTTTKTSQPQVIYIPLGGGGSTANTTWTDVGNAEVYFDLNDYPNFSEARFEGFIKVKNGNGKAFARLYDVTHNIGVQGSDIEANGENFTMVGSDPLAFWQGKNLYRIQVKSLNGYDAYIDSGRIKIVLK
jgi:hypothetical protein